MERLLGLAVCGLLLYIPLGLWAIGTALLVLAFKFWDARAAQPISPAVKAGCFALFFSVSCSACWLLYRR